MAARLLASSLTVSSDVREYKSRDMRDMRVFPFFMSPSSLRTDYTAIWSLWHQDPRVPLIELILFPSLLVHQPEVCILFKFVHADLHLRLEKKRLS